MQRKRNVREILIEDKLVPEDKLTAAEELSRKENKHLHQVLVELKLIPELKLLKVLADEWGFKAVDLTKMKSEPEVVNLIPEQIARRQVCVAFARQDNTLFVAMADPRDFLVVEDIGLRTGLEIKPYLALAHWINKILGDTYGGADSAQLDKLMESVSQAKPQEEEGFSLAAAAAEKKDISEVDASAPEVEKMVNAVILGALSMKASDIHVEPFEDPNGKNSKVMVRYRVDGMLRPATFTIPWSFRNAIVAKIKIMASLNITERRIPQSGRIQIIAKGNPIEFRVEMVPTVFGESCVMRILDRASVRVDIKIMGFLPDTEKKLLDQFAGIGGKKNFGLVLVCGPTGSGKSTTLYACLNYVNRPDIKILTAENPVEYNIDGIIQVPVNPDVSLGGNKKFDFASALRSFMRLDPDVIMVGEIRDEETAHIALEAAMTGHLVFSTIHTNDAPSALERLTQMGLPRFVVANTMKAVLAQRLARRLCKDCKKEGEMTPEEIAVFDANRITVKPGTKIFKAVGCDTCKGSGYKGRVGMHELLVLNDEIRQQLLDDPSAIPVKNMAIRNGMRLLSQDGLEKVLQGHTTVKEVLGGAG
ncbi:MAG: type IV pilus assembly protein PilB [Elusimicrobia bacterium]|nr:MAG: type IV pilus assembly protein PilB [Elusimicrobiota bacterium]KAF0155630.1 MAG: type IV pilus assembly protein PilB [Elusimicrobiota bacterium]